MTIESAIAALGFAPERQGSARFVRKFAGNTHISIDYKSDAPQKSRVTYPDGLVVHHKSTSTLASPENLVVIDCVARLLDKGYSADLIELEKTWTLGHKGKGRLDVLLRSPDRAAYALIECKTWGTEHIKERNRTLQDGGQLFSYFAQERAAQGLYLYSAKVASDERPLVELIRTSGLSGNSQEEVFNSWDRSLEPQGIFHEDSALYEDTFRGLRGSDLRQLDRQSGAGVFDSFSEILRRNVVSDKPNAFNKIFNLFLCKIADEDGHSPSDELDFQWKLGESEESFLERLENLYSKGMEEYLGVYLDRKYLAATNFQFLDVYDEPTHIANLKILREVVELLQPYKIRYSARHQYLSDFFEMLLNTGVKQEAGQFFTPIPLVQAIMQSLPVKEMIDARIATGSRVVAPLTIDYACGSGHFLTEAMTEIDKHLQAINPEELKGQQRSWLSTRRPNFEWAEDAIYGIERDQRLAKVSKVAGFLNGDGQARVLQADGLGDFQTEPGFTGALRTVSATQDLGKFDIVTSNPPYAVSNFRRNLESTPHLFRLYQHLSAESGEIECLFIERASQLLRDGGVTALILPLSVLSSTKTIYAATRRVIALDFEIVAMLELREKTFIATNTSTVCLFARRRPRKDLAKALKELQSLINDASRAGELEALKSHGIDLDELRETLKSTTTVEDAYESNLLAHALRARLDGESDAILAYSGESIKEQEGFLGYRFSRNRGNEGVRLIEPDSPEASGLIYGPGSVASAIADQFAGLSTPIEPALGKHVLRTPIEDLWNFQDWTILNPSAHFVEEQNPPSSSPHGDFIDEMSGRTVTLVELEETGLVNLVKGATYAKEQEVPRATATRILTASNVDRITRTLTFETFRYLRSDAGMNDVMKPRPNDIVMTVASGSLRHLGKIAVAQDAIDAHVGGFLIIVRTTDEAVRKILEYNFLSARFRRFVLGLKEQNINNLTITKLRSFPIHFPDDTAAFEQELLARETAV